MGILIKPLVTEKVTVQNEKGVFGFIVDKKANKIEIKNAIEKAYGVSVQAIRTAIIPGKPKSRYSAGKFLTGKTKSYKKAFVQLNAGEVIDFYSNI